MKLFRNTSGVATRLAFLLALVPLAAGVVELHSDHETLAPLHPGYEIAESCAPGLPLHVEASESSRPECLCCLHNLQSTGGELELTAFAAPSVLPCRLVGGTGLPALSAAPPRLFPRGPPIS